MKTSIYRLLAIAFAVSGLIPLAVLTYESVPYPHGFFLNRHPGIVGVMLVYIAAAIVLSAMLYHTRHARLSS